MHSLKLIICLKMRGKYIMVKEFITSVRASLWADFSQNQLGKRAVSDYLLETSSNIYFKCNHE